MQPLRSSCIQLVEIVFLFSDHRTLLVLVFFLVFDGLILSLIRIFHKSVLNVMPISLDKVLCLFTLLLSIDAGRLLGADLCH